jgi:hypothetical protein
MIQTLKLMRPAACTDCAARVTDFRLTPAGAGVLAIFKPSRAPPDQIRARPSKKQMTTITIGNPMRNIQF